MDLENSQSQMPNPETPSISSIVQSRNRLALLIGRLLAREWLRRQAADGDRIEKEPDKRPSSE